MRAPLTNGLSLTPIDFVPWLSAGYDLLIRGEYELRGQELTLEFRLYDVVAKKLLTSKRFLGREKTCGAMPTVLAMKSWRPDRGKRGFTSKILYVSNQSGNKELFLMDWDGFNPQQLTSNRSINISPDISPDGGRLSLPPINGAIQTCTSGPCPATLKCRFPAAQA